MKKILILVTLSILLLNFAHSQNLISVQNGGVPTFFTDINSAISNAQDGDTVYLAGFSYFPVGGKLTITKEIHIVGVGHNPDASSATGITYLFCYISLLDGADNSSFTGFYLTDWISTGTSSPNGDVDNITVHRCNTGTIWVNELSTNWYIAENVIRGSVYGFYTSSSLRAQSNLIANNIIEHGIYYFGINNVFSNNLLFDFSGSFQLQYIESCQFSNNIFLEGSLNTTDIVASMFYNNLFVSNFIVPDGSIGDNNLVNQNAASILVNQSGTTFSYEQDYHLNATSPGKSAGTDGSDVGIYGGPAPWKEGSIPFNPHIKSKTISSKTNSSGNINVNITVEAQEE